jgi:ribonuclease G
MADFLPEGGPRIELHEGPRPIFDLHAIEEEINRALERKVPLKSGGYLVIDQTESMTTIDVNTGGFVGHRNLEDTIFRTNLEAAVAIARQLRLRNLGGIIIIDFIDMTEEQHRQSIMDTLSKEMEKDRTKSIVVGWTRLGLLEVTRKKVRDNLDVSFYMPCSVCNGKGRVFSSQHPFY